MKNVIFAGNDYLGLARDPRLAEAMCRAAREFGVSATSGRFFVGWSPLHEQLECTLADFTGAEDACIISAAYLGGMNFFCTFAERFPVVFCDASSHTNLLLGMRAAGVQVNTFRHLDVSDLRRQLARHRGGPAVVVTDGVYGISGELAPLADLAEAARGAGAELFIDDAHGVFALGQNGRGSVEACGLDPNSVTILGSMSKALGAGGGFFAGRREIIEALKRGPGSVGSTPSPPPLVAACLRAIEIVRTEPGIRARMWDNAKRMREILATRGIGVVASDSPISGMVLRDEDEARKVAAHFESRGLIIRYSKYPSEPRVNLLRSVARACYSEDDLARFARAVAEIDRVE